MAPAQAPIWIARLSVEVLELDEVRRISGATVRVLSGSRKGATCATGVVSCTIDNVYSNETFTVEVSKTGYTTTTFEHRIELNGAAGNSTFKRVTLAPNK